MPAKHPPGACRRQRFNSRIVMAGFGCPLVAGYGFHGGAYTGVEAAGGRSCMLSSLVMAVRTSGL